MLAKVETATVVGLAAVPVVVEVDVPGRGLPNLAIVGLPDATVRESRERLRSAIRNTQYDWPAGRVTVNLAPADVRKEGSAFDLPIALGILAASGQLDPAACSNAVALGELALDGRLRPVSGVLAVALSLRGAGKRLLLPAANAAEAAWVEGAEAYPFQHLHQAIEHLSGREPVEPFRRDGEGFARGPAAGAEAPDFSEVKGQKVAKRALEVAAAGGHHVLLLGPPGSGKTMLAQRIPTILPSITLEEALETTQVYSVLGLLRPHQSLILERPFRSPHHTISDAGLVGGGSFPRPGEISLAHHGVLFLDEFPEFSRGAVEALRQPLEEGRITVARAQGSMTFPTRIMLVASMNPCPCGSAGQARRACLCTPAQVRRYRGRISGPVLDRMDLQLEIPGLSVLELSSEELAEPSSAIRSRVEQARARQQGRFREEPGVFCNAQMRHRHLRRWCRLTAEGKDLLRTAAQVLGLSARAHDRILKVSRTIADLAGCVPIQPEHLAEAIQYRALDRLAWV